MGFVYALRSMSVPQGTADDHIWPMVQHKLDVLSKAGLTKDDFTDSTAAYQKVFVFQISITLIAESKQLYNFNDARYESFENGVRNS